MRGTPSLSVLAPLSVKKCRFAVSPSANGLVGAVVAVRRTKTKRSLVPPRLLLADLRPRVDTSARPSNSTVSAMASL